MTRATLVAIAIAALAFGIAMLAHSAEQNDTDIVQVALDGTRRELATLRPPLTVDNFEGLAVREEGAEANRRTFLYIVSDDNFSSGQRTLLMKFEVLPEG